MVYTVYLSQVKGEQVLYKLISARNSLGAYKKDCFMCFARVNVILNG